MATLVAYQSGNLTGATTFKTVETGTRALQDTLSVANNTNTTTSTVFNGNTEDFTIANLSVIEGIMLYCKQTTTTGTVKVVLSDDSGTTETRTVTVNATDLPTSPSWVFFKFGSTLTGDGGTDYAIGIQGSSAGNATFYRSSATAADWNHVVRTSTTATAGAGDRLYIVGDLTGAGTGNDYTVTINDTASTDFGAIDVGHRGILDSGTSASTNYTLKHSGVVNTWGGSTVNIGTTGTAMPRNSSITITMDSTTNVEFGWVLNPGTTIGGQGLSRTVGNNSYYAKLNTDEAANSTDLGVDTNTGWLDNDLIAVASTTQTSTQSEQGALNGNAGAASLTVDGFGGTGGGVANAHSGTSPTQAEVILLTRNVVFQGASSSLQGYIDIKSGVVGDFDWVEFKWLGSNTANKRGIDIATTTTAVSFNYCSFHDFVVTGSRGINYAGASGNGLTIDSCVFYNIADEHFINVASTGVSTVTNNIFMKNITASKPLVALVDVGLTFTGNTAISATGIGIDFQEGAATLGTCSSNTAHSCGSYNMQYASGLGTMTDITVWRNAANGGFNVAASTQASMDLTINNLVSFGNNTNSFRITNGVVTLNSPVLNGDTTFATTNGISSQGNFGNAIIRVNSGDLSTVSGIKVAHTNDINFTSAMNILQIYLNNTKLGGTNELASGTQAQIPVQGFIVSQKHDQTAGLHKAWKRYGTITIETSTVQAGGFSMKMTPNNASFKLDSSIPGMGGFMAAIANGTTSTPTIYVYEDASYNGNRARLIVKRNDAIGITSDTVLATATAASDGAWEALSGTTASATDDGVTEFVIDCDGTAGNLFVDTVSVV